jgi:predicted O-methyltransferase YrrM
MSMSDTQWTTVDEYLTDLLAPSDDVLKTALRASENAGLPPIQVTATQGKLLHLLVRIMGARRILEIGTLGGYSTIWLGRALPPGGRLVTLESEPIHARVARSNIAQAGLEATVELRLGPALETLPLLAAENPDPFDLIFIDADKANTAPYFDWSLTLSRPGSLIIADNVVRKGAVTNAQSDDPSVRGVRRFLNMLAVERRVSATAIQTVGSKGYDGFVLALVLTSAKVSRAERPAQ